MFRAIWSFVHEMALFPRCTLSLKACSSSGSTIFLSDSLWASLCVSESAVEVSSPSCEDKLSFGASHHKHFGMSSSYFLPHFLQIILASKTFQKQFSHDICYYSSITQRTLRPYCLSVPYMYQTWVEYVKYIKSALFSSSSVEVQKCASEPTWPPYPRLSL